MKKTSFALVALSAGAVLLNVSAVSAAESGTFPASESSKAPILEIAFGIGAMELDKDRVGFDDDTGFGLNMGIRFTAPEFPIGAEWRFYGSTFSIDDSDYSFPIGNDTSYQVYCDDCDYTIAGTDFSVLFNFNPGGVINPYIGAGFLYESATFSADVHTDVPYGWSHHHSYYEEWDEDGITFLARVGLDLRSALLYARFDAGYIGEIYDADDTNQFLLSGDFGVNLIPAVRLDCFGHYFTEYKSFYIGVGVTASL